MEGNQDNDNKSPNQKETIEEPSEKNANREVNAENSGEDVNKEDDPNKTAIFEDNSSNPEFNSDHGKF